MTQRVACFTGRFQPFHRQHLEVLAVLSESFDRIIIGVTNPDISQLQENNASQHRHTDRANPFTYESRVKIIESSLLPLVQLTKIDTVVEIRRFDLTQPKSWDIPSQTVFALRIFSPWEESKLSLFIKNGFKTITLPSPTIKLSASDIRESLNANEQNWESLVVPQAIETIKSEWRQLSVPKVSV